MKVKSNLPHNIGLTGSYPEAEKGALLGESPRFTIISRATHDIDDALWALLANSAKGLIKSGKLTVIKGPVLSEEDQDAADAAEDASLRAQMFELNKRKEERKAAAEADKDPGDS